MEAFGARKRWMRSVEAQSCPRVQIVSGSYPCKQPKTIRQRAPCGQEKSCDRDICRRTT